MSKYFKYLSKASPKFFDNFANFKDYNEYSEYILSKESSELSYYFPKDSTSGTDKTIMPGGFPESSKTTEQFTEVDLGEPAKLLHPSSRITKTDSQVSESSIEYPQLEIESNDKLKMWKGDDPTVALLFMIPRLIKFIPKIVSFIRNKLSKLLLFFKTNKTQVQTLEANLNNFTNYDYTNDFTEWVHVNNFKKLDFPEDNLLKFFDGMQNDNSIIGKLKIAEDNCILLNIAVKSCPFTSIAGHDHRETKIINSNSSEDIFTYDDIPLDLKDPKLKFIFVFYYSKLIYRDIQKIDDTIYGTSCDITFNYRYISQLEYDKLR